ncbi:hypothetical protein M9435_000685 [Picochlorum sp. BPE23]|nr:hypothetical protein M9435_000685 [Picochlorum sp. BPE23]WPT16421.1 MOB kinase activator-like 1A [Picochlorum sp. SENEW3]|mmetsp:Transcript_6685/g.13276  ORF Transcript_6685/g.13276 Transcript_6685/m.13276 type:complete len:219 (+) Transcript_6685:42-698(+)
MASFFNFSRRAGTVRSVKNVAVGTKGPTLRKHIEQTLGSGTVEQAVKLPQGEDPNEWIAVNTVFFYNAISVLYNVIDGTLCDEEHCPIMSAGPQFEYLWADGIKVKTPIKLSASKYVNALFDWIEEQLDDPSLFPRGLGGSFPKDFLPVVKNILKRIFRVYAHMYHSHFKQILGLGMETHVNTCFRHFILFVKEFSLVDEKELMPMQELVSRIVSHSQ